MTITVESNGIRTTGIRRAALRTADLARARVFYIARLGFPLLVDEPDRFVFSAGTSVVSVRARSSDTGGGSTSNEPDRPCRACLDYIALACADVSELRNAAIALTAAGIEHSGVRHDPTEGTEFVAFNDPDGIPWTLCTT